jgi:hypothetical protein
MKRSHIKVTKYNGAISFTYVPLAYLLKNRVYIGEVHHGGKWFKGEQKPILDQQIFERVQALLKTNANGSKVKHFDSGALLQGKLYDDKGNLMGPSFSTKNSVRYRFYVSSALLRGRKADAGSVGRVSAMLVENAVRSALALHQQAGRIDDAPLDIEHVQRVVVARDRLSIAFLDSKEGDTKRQIQVPWSCASRDSAAVIDSKDAPGEGLIQAIVRAHVWLQQLADGTHDSVEELAETNGIHPKVIRQALRLAFLSSEITSAILEGKQPLTLALARIPKLLPLPWATQQRLLPLNNCN